MNLKRAGQVKGDQVRGPSEKWWGQKYGSGSQKRKYRLGKHWLADLAGTADGLYLRCEDEDGIQRCLSILSVGDGREGCRYVAEEEEEEELI